MPDPGIELFNAMSSLFISGRHSDITVVCRNHRYPVHKAVLCSRSHFFDGACNGHFLESKKGEIDLSEEDEEIVEHMIHYFYYLDYLVSDNLEGKTQNPDNHVPTNTSCESNLCDLEDPLIATAAATGGISEPAMTVEPAQVSMKVSKPTRSASPKAPSPQTRKYSRMRKVPMPHEPNGLGFSKELSSQDVMEDDINTQETPPLVIHARVYALAEKYGIYGLKTLAREKFESLVSDKWDESDFLEATEEVYTTTVDNDRGLRNIILQSFRKWPELASSPDVQNTVQHVPPLAFDLYRVSWGIPMST